MFMTRSEYDRGVTTFSPEGRLFQVEYAIEAIKLGSTAIAILTQEGIVLAVERRTQSPLMIPSSLDKIMEIDSHVACAVSGLTADALLKMAVDRLDLPPVCNVVSSILRRAFREVWRWRRYHAP